MAEPDPQGTLGDETEEIARRLQPIIYIGISLCSTPLRDRPAVPAVPLFGTDRNWMFA
jgi:hypothetical protein